MCVCVRVRVRVCVTFEEPVGVTLFGTVGLEEGEDVLGDVFHHACGEGGVVQIGDVLRLYHLVFLFFFVVK